MIVLLLLRFYFYDESASGADVLAEMCARLALFTRTFVLVGSAWVLLSERQTDVFQGVLNVGISLFAVYATVSQGLFFWVVLAIRWDCPLDRRLEVFAVWWTIVALVALVLAAYLMFLRPLFVQDISFFRELLLPTAVFAYIVVFFAGFHAMFVFFERRGLWNFCSFMLGTKTG